MSRALGLALTVCFCRTAWAATASQPAPSLDPGLDSELVQIDDAARQVKDLSAHFEQDKFTAMLKKPLVSTGVVRGAGSVIRWDTGQPEPCSLYADHAQLILYYPGQKLEEIYPIDQRMSDLLSSPVPRLDIIRKHFAIDRAASGNPAVAGTLALRLTPTDSELARHISQVTVVLDLKTGLTLQVQTTDADGDRTQIKFSQIHTNTGLDPTRLQLTVPSDTTVSHPLEAAPAGQSSNGSP